MKEQDSRDIVPLAQTTIVRPAVTVDEALQTWNEYKDLRRQLIEPADIQKIQGRDFLRKSYWRKLEKFFNLRLELRSEGESTLQALIRRIPKKRKVKGQWEEYQALEVEYFPLGTSLELKPNEESRVTIVFSCVYRAIAPNGVFVDADGTCDCWEKGYASSIHNVRATASSRAKNRAISDLVGGGELSAEEMQGADPTAMDVDSVVADYEARIRDVVLAALDRIDSMEPLKEFIGLIAPILKESPHASQIRAHYRKLLDKLGSSTGEE